MWNPNPGRWAVLCCLLALGCAATPDNARQTASRGDTKTAVPSPGADFWNACTPMDAEKWTAAAEGDSKAALKAAKCRVHLAEAETDPTRKLAHVRAGKQLAQTVVSARPEQAAGHYVLAVLIGLEASLEPLKGLDRVPGIEQEALAAVCLDPSLDHGGPHRMLGDLYRRAPAFPVSVGDLEESIAQCRDAVAQDPAYPPNRVALALALAEDGNLQGACAELAVAFRGLVRTPRPLSPKRWKEALGLMNRICATLQNEGKK